MEPIRRDFGCSVGGLSAKMKAIAVLEARTECVLSREKSRAIRESRPMSDSENVLDRVRLISRCFRELCTSLAWPARNGESESLQGVTPVCVPSRRLSSWTLALLTPEDMTA